MYSPPTNHYCIKSLSTLNYYYYYHFSVVGDAPGLLQALDSDIIPSRSWRALCSADHYMLALCGAALSGLLSESTTFKKMLYFYCFQSSIFICLFPLFYYECLSINNI